MPQQRETKPGRRPGRPDTRDEILTAARTLFASRGYGGTSVRAVAKAANVDPALISHYFGSKEGLLRATLALPIDPLNLIAEVLANGPDKVPERLVQTFVTVWDSPETGLAMVAFLRTLLASEETTALVRDFLGATVLKAMADQVLADLDPREAELRVGLVASHLLGIVISRKVIGVEPLASIDSRELQQIITPVVARYLFGDLDIPAVQDQKGTPA